MSEEKKESPQEESKEEAECGCERHEAEPMRPRYWHRHGPMQFMRHGFPMMQRFWGYPLISVEREIEILEEMKKRLEGRLEIVNKRLEQLKK